MSELAVKIAHTFYQARTSARLILGDRYQLRMEQYGAIIQGVAKDYNLDVVAATQKIARESKLEGGALMCLLAAAVELAEPSAPAEGGK